MANFNCRTISVLPMDCSSPACVADIDGSQDGVVGPADLAVILGNWGPVRPNDPIADLNNDGMVGPADLAIVPFSQPGIVTIPLGFITLVVVSLVTQASRKGTT